MTFDIHDNDDSDYEPENDIGTDLDTSSSSNSTDPDSDDDNQLRTKYTHRELPARETLEQARVGLSPCTFGACVGFCRVR